MRLWKHASPRRSAIMLSGVAALGAAALPVGGAAATATVQAPAPHLHLFPTLQHHPDCVLPIVIAVECAGAGTPMSSGGGTVQTNPAVYIVFWGWGGRDPSGQAAYQQSFF